MAISLADLRIIDGDGPPRVIIYGPEGIGKTTLASEFPNPAFLQTESGKPKGLALPSFGKLDSFGAVMEAITALYTEPHDKQTVVTDSVSELERLVWQETCARGDEKGNAKQNMEDFGYGKGYVYAGDVWREYLDGIAALRRDRGMAVVMIAHSVIERFDDPETVSYDRYAVAVHSSDKTSSDHRGLIQREMDAILLLKNPVSVQKEDKGFKRERAIAVGSGSNVQIHCVGRPAYVAKNRYNMPETIPYVKGNGYAALAEYFPPIAAQPTTKRAKQKEAA